MSSEEEVANELPSFFDSEGLSRALKNPTQAFQLLDKNGDGKVTTEDLRILLEQFGIKGMAGKVVAKFIFKKLDADHSGTIEPSDLTNADGILMKLFSMKKSQGWKDLFFREIKQEKRRNEKKCCQTSSIFSFYKPALLRPTRDVRGSSLNDKM